MFFILGIWTNAIKNLNLTASKWNNKINNKNKFESFKTLLHENRCSIQNYLLF